MADRGAPNFVERWVLGLFDALSRASIARRVTLVVTVAACGVALDWITGPGASMLLVYAVATVLAAWSFVRRWPTVVVAVLASFSSALLNVTSPDAPLAGGVVWFNAVLRAATLGLFGLTVWSFRRHVVETERLAVTDALTGVLSRRAIIERLDVAVHDRSHRTSSVVFFDIDGLKLVNDRQGHAAGDELIRDFVGAVRVHVRPGDAFGRLGGDEFLLLCPAASRSDAERIVERIVASGCPRVSWGIATSDEHSDAEAMMTAADAQMYAAKQRLRPAG